MTKRESKHSLVDTNQNPALLTLECQTAELGGFCSAVGFVGPLNRTNYLTGANAAGTDADATGGAFNHCLHLMKIRKPTSLCLNVGVRHQMAGGWAFFTIITNSSHT